MRLDRLAAWSVHLYTACGVVVGLLALDATMRESYGAAFGWLTLAFFLDSTDGTLARRARVREVLPHFDGARLDDIVDYLNYAFVPMLLVYRAGLLPPGAFGLAVAACPLLASAYGFCQANAKTADHFFLGFPSYWNIVALYMYVLRAPVWFNVASVLLLSVMVFVPIRYLYPSRTTAAQKQTIGLAAVWGVLVIWLLLQFPSPSRTLAVVSLFFPAYYVGLSWRLHFTRPPSQ